MLPTGVAGPPFAAFVLASLVLAATPGPGVAYIVARTLGQGRRAGLASVAGVALGNLVNALGAALGLAALLAVSAGAYTVLRLAGAAYLVWLGWQMWRLPAAGVAGAAVPAPAARLFRDGFVVAVLNPKTAIFFAAFLPQFVDPALPALAQSLLFGAVFVLTAAATDTAYVLLAGLAAPVLGRAAAARAARLATAAVLVGLGAYAALAGAPRPR